MADAHSQVITRFAPSPTGHLHIGGARTALFCWAYAKGQGGRFVLRIEDTDRARSTESAAAGILEDLAWLGIDWQDGPSYTFETVGERGGQRRAIGGDMREVGPFHQSERQSDAHNIYAEFFDRLIEQGHAYPAFETPEQLDAMRAEAQAAKRTFVYRQREEYDHAAAIERMGAEPHVLRLKMPASPVVVEDAVLGRVEFPYEELDDFVIRKRDGFPTYHFAVVVDDELMGVTHVLRGQEHLNNTPKHVALMGLLTHRDGSPFGVPTFAHLALIFNPDGSKMSKRDKDKAVRAAAKELDASPTDLLTDDAFRSWRDDKRAQLELEPLEAIAAKLGVPVPEVAVDDFRRSGYLPEVVCNAIALLGWNPGLKGADGKDLERFDMAFLAEKFGLDRVGKKASTFDRAKLLAFNAETLQTMPADEFQTRYRAWLERYTPDVLAQLGDRFELACVAIQPRAKTFGDAIEAIRFALVDDVEYADAAVAKGLHKGEPRGVDLLARFEAEVLNAWSSPFEPGVIVERVKQFCDSAGVGMGKIAGPLRVALTGTNVSPGLGETLGLLGLDEVRRRVRRCVEVHG